MKENIKLVISIIFDAFGYASYLVPFLGGVSDFIFAPIQALWITYAYKSVPGVVVGFFEEVFMFDFIPTCTIVHFYTKYKKKE